MSVYTSDQEDIQMIKNWWRENGKFLIATVVTVLVLSYSWRYWNDYKTTKINSASILYEQMLNDVSNREVHDFENHANLLMTKYSDTPYASMAALMVAKSASENNALQGAIAKLHWVVDNSKNRDLKQIARLREARLLLAMQQYQSALAALEVVEVITYLPLINEIKGDIYLAQGKHDAARSAYQNALNSISKTEPYRAFLQMKYDQLVL